jgi:hypothetical protein
VGAIPVTDKGIGIATLGANGLVPLEQLPPIGGGVPAGGTPGQILRKKTVADFDTAWSDEAGGGITLTPPPTGTFILQSVDGVLQWIAVPKLLAVNEG